MEQCIENTNETAPNNIKAKPYLTMADLAERFQVNRSTIYRAIKEGEFPPPVRIFSCPRWSLKSILAYERKRERLSPKWS